MAMNRKMIVSAAVCAGLLMFGSVAQAAPEAWACGCIDPDSEDYPNTLAGMEHECTGSRSTGAGLGGLRVRLAEKGDTAEGAERPGFPDSPFHTLTVGCDGYIDRKPVCYSDRGETPLVEAYVWVMTHDLNWLHANNLRIRSTFQPLPTNNYLGRECPLLAHLRKSRVPD